jgi:hypothetical protein
MTGPLNIIAQHQLCGALRQADIDWLLVRDVRPEAMIRSAYGESDHLAIDRVVFLDGDRFEFCRYMPGEATKVVVLLARDPHGEVDDLVAWEPNGGGMATWLGRAALLGAEVLTGPRLDGPALVVHPDPLTWLKADRTGVVIIHLRAAASLLREASTLALPDLATAQRLRDAMRVRFPELLIAKPEAHAA